MGAGPDPARVLITTDAVGGVWRYSVDLANELIARGVDVLLACLGPAPSEKQKSSLGNLLPDRLISREFALEWMQTPWLDVERSKDWLLSIAKEFVPDVVHLNGYALASANWPVPVITVAHSCVRSWWRAVHGSAPGPEWGEYEQRVLDGLRATDEIVAPSRFMADAIADEYGIERNEIRVIHNFSLKRPVKRKKEPFVLAAGRMWDEAKNLRMLEAVAPRLQWPLVLAGGRLSRDELDERLASAGIFAHPALYEPFGLAVLEAAHAGCALVLADIPSLRELWEGAVMFVDPRRQDLWLLELNRLINDADERERLGAAAAARAERYDVRESVHPYLDVYRSVVKNAGGKAGAAA